MKLVLHIGAHKTATTTIQKSLAQNRKILRNSGIWYPAYSDVFPSMSDHYAHLDVAKGLMSDSKRFTPEKVAKFFANVHAQAIADPGLEYVLISAEPFYRGRASTGGSYWQRREQYISDLKEIVAFDDAEIVLVLRRQDDYLESLYNEHVKATRYTKDIWTFFEEYRSRFEYRKQIEAWSRHFASLKVCIFEDLVKSRSVTNAFLKQVFGSNAAEIGDLMTSNRSLPIDLVEFKRLLNATSLSRAGLGTMVPRLQAIADSRPPIQKGRVSRLSSADCIRLLAEFESDNEWINRNYLADRSASIFPSKIAPRSKPSEVDVAACMNIVAEMLKTQVM